MKDWVRGWAANASYSNPSFEKAFVLVLSSNPRGSLPCANIIRADCLRIAAIKRLLRHYVTPRKTSAARLIVCAQTHSSLRAFHIFLPLFKCETSQKTAREWVKLESNFVQKKKIMKKESHSSSEIRIIKLHQSTKIYARLFKSLKLLRIFLSPINLLTYLLTKSDDSANIHPYFFNQIRSHRQGRITKASLRFLLRNLFLKSHKKKTNLFRKKSDFSEKNKQRRRENSNVRTRGAGTSDCPFWKGYEKSARIRVFVKLTIGGEGLVLVFIHRQNRTLVKFTEDQRTVFGFTRVSHTVWL